MFRIDSGFLLISWQQIIVGSGRGLYLDLLTEPVHSPVHGLWTGSVQCLQIAITVQAYRHIGGWTMRAQMSSCLLRGWASDSVGTDVPPIQ